MSRYLTHKDLYDLIDLDQTMFSLTMQYREDNILPLIAHYQLKHAGFRAFLLARLVENRPLKNDGSSVENDHLNWVCN